VLPVTDSSRDEAVTKPSFRTAIRIRWSISLAFQNNYWRVAVPLRAIRRVIEIGRIFRERNAASLMFQLPVEYRGQGSMNEAAN
jgi:hypothetical protein